MSFQRREGKNKRSKREVRRSPVDEFPPEGTFEQAEAPHLREERLRKGGKYKGRKRIKEERKKKDNHL